MIYTSVKSIQDNIKDRNRPFWRMYQRDEKNLIAETVDLENINADKSAKILEDEINALNGSGFVIVKLYSQPLTKGGNNTGILTYNVRIGSDNDDSIKGNQNSFSNIGLITNFYEKINGLQMELINQKSEAAIKDLERKYEEKNKVAATDPMLKEILSIAKSAIYSYNNKNNNVQQPQQPAQPQPQQSRPINGIDDRKEFIDHITRWHKADENYLEVLKAIVFFAENDPDVYKFQTDLLINQSKQK
jgi:hypothetical protein